MGGALAAGARSGATLAVEDPATGATICTVADAGAADAADALAAAARGAGRLGRDARRASGPASCAAPPTTSCAGPTTLAMLITLEMGKPLAESRDEVAFAAEYLEWCAEEAVRIGGHRAATPPTARARIVTRRRPVGPCLLVTPWNFPLAVPARGVAAALAAGCTASCGPRR